MGDPEVNSTYKNTYLKLTSAFALSKPGVNTADTERKTHTSYALLNPEVYSTSILLRCPHQQQTRLVQLYRVQTVNNDRKVIHAFIKM